MGVGEEEPEYRISILQILSENPLQASLMFLEALNGQLQFNGQIHSCTCFRV